MKKMHSTRVAVVVVALLLVGSLTLAGSPGPRKAARADRFDSASSVDVDQSRQQSVNERQNQNDQSYQPMSAGYRIRIMKTFCSSESGLPSLAGVFGGAEVTLMTKLCGVTPRK